MNAAPRVEVLVSEGCPHAEAALDLARRVVERLIPSAQVERLEIDTPEKAAEVGFLGSPSIRVDGVDVEDRHTARGALCGRTYEGGAGLPPQWRVEAAMLRVLEPRGILFLCVANSARSQIAEGVARSVMPPGIKVCSAGSRPTEVRPEAVAVLEEIGIDISHHRSKAVAEIPAAEVDTVITLCGEEECPLFLGKATRLHWGLQDPARIQGTEQERLAAFRACRDEMRQRLVVLAHTFSRSMENPGVQSDPSSRRAAMEEKREAKSKKKGFFATLKESMAKTSEGCGPTCGCHAEEKKGKAKDGEATDQAEKGSKK